MFNPHHSKGAPYVRSYGWVRHSWSGDDVPCLSWHPRESLFVAKDGSMRRIWDLQDREMALKYCLITNVKFLDATQPGYDV